MTDEGYDAHEKGMTQRSGKGMWEQRNSGKEEPVSKRERKRVKIMRDKREREIRNTKDLFIVAAPGQSPQKSVEVRKILYKGYSGVFQKATSFTI